ncbi:zf-HC2 domain-containing protein [uncultured Endozoicomonas sp.]|uniref:zf-HC2 domain-containing protein n=1 Tax=uncultured Endozoicomonas sp. TaxID=432652 RepID=UPI002607DA26|nr:zf-HC2 domain-containing protein [uncultured Endozoicomonas sp.]
MLTCRDIQRLASALEDGDLGWRQKINVKIHLFICDHCRQFIRQFFIIRQLSEKSVVKLASDEEVQSIIEKINKK